MDDQPPTPKQIARKYRDNPGYFGKSHPLRRLRWWSFAIAAVCSLAVATTFHRWGGGNVFSKGAISKNHAGFANDCRACHLDAETDALKALLAERPSGSSMRAVFEESGKAARWPKELSRMDEACVKCHASSALHQPQSAALALRGVSDEMTRVHAVQCSVCHREHTGHGAMAQPDRHTCASCHGDADSLRLARTSQPLKPAHLAATGENRDLGDGLVRFLAPEKKPAPMKPFANYAGHPPFRHEQAGLRDPADLKFNHARHERDDVTVLGPNQKLTCADCHTPGPGGVLYQPVSYERHCQQCHSLQIQPSLPKLRIPHGDAEKVRYFLASIQVAIENGVRAEGLTDAADVRKRTDAEVQTLRNRGAGTLAELEQRVFFDGDPKSGPNDRRMKAGDRKFLTECAKCHTVQPGDAGHAPHVNPPYMAERWVQRGPFTHAPHLHMGCADCHQAAHTSKLTSDILLPPQKLCAECHRTGSSANPAAAARTSATGNGALAAAQRRGGGIKSDCLDCHVFHAPPGAR